MPRYYSEEDVEYMTAVYTEAEDKKAAVEEISEKLERSKQAIIGKLNALGIYIKQSEYESVYGGKPITKIEMVHEIAELVDAEPELLQGMAKTPKPDLYYFMQRLQTEIKYYEDEISELKEQLAAEGGNLREKHIGKTEDLMDKLGD